MIMWSLEETFGNYSLLESKFTGPEGWSKLKLKDTRV
jgi:hypothetical protein